jgi:hypothetical protein
LRLRQQITAATAAAITVVDRRFMSAPVMSRRRLSGTRGISTNGIPKDSTTWETTVGPLRVETGHDHHQRGRERHRPPDGQRDPTAEETPP